MTKETMKLKWGFREVTFVWSGLQWVIDKGLARAGEEIVIHYDPHMDRWAAMHAGHGACGRSAQEALDELRAQVNTAASKKQRCLDIGVLKDIPLVTMQQVDEGIGAIKKHLDKTDPDTSYDGVVVDSINEEEASSKGSDNKGK